MNKHNSFEVLVANYVGIGFITALILSAIGLLIGWIAFDENRKYYVIEKQLYEELEKKEEPVEKNITTEKNEKAPEQKTDTEKAQEEEKLSVQTLFRRMALSSSPQETLASLVMLDKHNDSKTYLNILFSNKDKIFPLVKGEIPNLSSEVKVPSWKTFFKWFVAIALLVLSLGCSIQYILVTIFEYNESMLDWPLKKWWTYPSIFFMLPLLGPCMAIELPFFIKKRGWEKREQQERQEAERLEAQRQAQMAQELQPPRPARPSEPVFDESLYSQQKELAQKRIEDARGRFAETQQHWQRFFARTLDEKTVSLGNSVTRYRATLSELGKQITSTQKALALEEKKLAQWKNGVDALKQAGSKEYDEELQRILRLSPVRAVKIDENNIMHIYTDTLHISYDGSRYEIGMYVISIGLSTDRIEVDCLASAHPRLAKHPYARDGSICWGNMTEPISHMLQQREYAVAVSMILMAMQNAEGDAPQKVLEWRKVS